MFSEAILNKAKATLQVKRQGLVDERSTQKRAVESECASRGVPRSGMHDRRILEVVQQHVADSCSAAFDSIHVALELDGVTYTPTLAADVAAFVRDAVPEGAGLRFLKDSLPDADERTLERFTADLGQARERAFVEIDERIATYVSELRRDHALSWRWRVGIVVSVLMALTALVFQLLPEHRDDSLPSDGTGSAVRPSETVPVELQVPLPESFSKLTLHEALTVGSRSLLKLLSESESDRTTLQAAAMIEGNRGRHAQWVGQVVDVRSRGLSASDSVLIMTLSPASREYVGAAQVVFEPGLHDSLLSVHRGSWVVVRGELDFVGEQLEPSLAHGRLVRCVDIAAR